MKRKKTIWYISKYTNPSGTASVGNRGVLLMKYIARMGYEVHVFRSPNNHLTKNSIKYSNNSYPSFGLHWHNIIVKNYSNPNSISRMISWLQFELIICTHIFRKVKKPETIIVSSPSLLSILSGYFLKVIYNSRLIFEVRDIWPLTLSDDASYSKHNPLIVLLGLIEKFGYKIADHIIGTMPKLDRHIKEKYNYSNTPVSTIPMGICLEEEKNNKSIDINYIEKYFPKNKFIVGYLGTIGKTNALETLFESAKQLNAYKDIHFVLIGEGALKSKFISMYDYLDNITFAPSIQKNYVNDVLNYVDLAYFSTYPSKLWEYGLSLNKVIDYMNSGTPILASYSGHQTMINESGCGYFVEAGEVNLLSKKIIEISKIDKLNLSRIGLKGKNWLIKNRNYRNLASSYIDIIFPKK